MRAGPYSSSASTPKATTSGMRNPAPLRRSKTVRPAAAPRSLRAPGVRPTYVVTHKVATDPRSVEMLRFVLLRGTCEIGAHHHAWETPPCSPDDVARHGYAAWVPSAQFEQQLGALTEAITCAVGRTPGHLSIGPFRLRGLARRRARAGRISRRVERRAALLRSAQGRTGLRRSAAEAVLSGVRQRRPVRIERCPRSAMFGRTRSPGAAAPRLDVRACAVAVSDQAHSQETGDCADAVAAAILLLTRRHEALARQLAARGEIVLNMLFHSSEAIVGGSPYNRTQGELDAFFDRLERFFDFAVRELGATP